MCQESVCACSSHGACLHKGELVCFCENGWGGETCDQPLFGKAAKRCLNDCNGHGFCAPLLGLCRCLQAYDGADCSDDDHVSCPNHCSGHGRCADNGFCYCMSDYTGVDCSVPRLSPSGESRGLGISSDLPSSDEFRSTPLVDTVSSRDSHGRSDAEGIHARAKTAPMSLSAPVDNRAGLLAGPHGGAMVGGGETQNRSTAFASQAINALFPSNVDKGRENEALGSIPVQKTERSKATALLDQQGEGHFPVVQFVTWILLLGLAAGIVVVCALPCCIFEQAAGRDCMCVFARVGASERLRTMQSSSLGSNDEGNGGALHRTQPLVAAMVLPRTLEARRSKCSQQCSPVPSTVERAQISLTTYFNGAA